MASATAGHAATAAHELLMVIIRGAQAPANSASGTGLPGAPPDADRLQAHAAQVFADDLAACPSRRSSSATLSSSRPYRSR
jgi:hypothetical protein